MYLVCNLCIAEVERYQYKIKMFLKRMTEKKLKNESDQNKARWIFNKVSNLIKLFPPTHRGICNFHSLKCKSQFSHINFKSHIIQWLSKKKANFSHQIDDCKLKCRLDICRRRPLTVFNGVSKCQLISPWKQSFPDTSFSYPFALGLILSSVIFD